MKSLSFLEVNWQNINDFFLGKRRPGCDWQFETSAGSAELITHKNARSNGDATLHQSLLLLKDEFQLFTVAQTQMHTHSDELTRHTPEKQLNSVDRCGLIEWGCRPGFKSKWQMSYLGKWRSDGWVGCSMSARPQTLNGVENINTPLFAASWFRVALHLSVWHEGTILHTCVRGWNHTTSQTHCPVLASRIVIWIWMRARRNIKQMWKCDGFVYGTLTVQHSVGKDYFYHALMVLILSF